MYWQLDFWANRETGYSNELDQNSFVSVLVQYTVDFRDVLTDIDKFVQPTKIKSY